MTDAPSRNLSGKKIAILATNGFEQSELEIPRDRLRAAGAQVDVVSPEQGQIKGWKEKDWGASVPVDKRLEEANPETYDAVVLPGGQINPDLLRVNAKAIDFIRTMYEQGKVVAAVCHGPWLLIEAGIAKGRKATSYHSIKTDMQNAGAEWSDQPVVTDAGVITSRKPDDLEAFSKKIGEELCEGRHTRQPLETRTR